MAGLLYEADARRRGFDGDGFERAATAAGDRRDGMCAAIGGEVDGGSGSEKLIARAADEDEEKQ
jgi:hypothetical protein